MRRRPVAQYAPLTSLLDVLFILVFASLIYSAGLEARQKSQDDSEKPAAAATPAPPGLVSIDPERLRKAALAEILAGLESRQAVVARIAQDGRLRQLERRQDGVPAVTPVELPLVERVADPDVNLVYLGDRSPDLRLCSLIRLQLGTPDLSSSIVIVALDVPLDQMSVALARGLQRDVDRCTGEQRGVAVLLDPRATGQVVPAPAPNQEEKTP
jgi:hypothetical protein